MGIIYIEVKKMSNNWDKTIVTGHLGEKIVAERLGGDVIFNISEDINVLRGWDLEWHGYKIEVKTDLRAAETGNVYIETVQNGKKSGINVTIADLFFIVTFEEIIIIYTNNLKEYLSTNEVRYHKNNKIEGYLLPLSIARTLALRVLTNYDNDRQRLKVAKDLQDG